MKKLIYIVMFLVMFFPVSSFALTEEKEKSTVSENTEIVTLDACVDGDTAKFKDKNGEVIKARFLAIDTPETVHPTKGVEPFGKDASNYTCESLTNAKEIKLEYDSNSDEEDNYGRKLVWVFVDGVLLQDSLISQGYAEVAYLYGNYKYTSLLEDSEAIAKVKKVGVWSVEESDEETIEEVGKDNNKNDKDESKGFFDRLIDGLLAKIFDFVDELLEKLLKMVEEML